jgi:hypothetical protein
MSQKALSALTGLIVLLCSSVCYSSWTTPVLVTGSVPPDASGAYNVTPNSEAVQRTVSFTSQARVLYNHNQTTFQNGQYPYIQEALSTNGGSSWTSWNTVYSSPTNLTQYSPSLVLSNNVLHATWYQANSTQTGDIFYARSTDFGTSWTVIHPTLWQNQLEMDGGCKEFPHLAVSTNGQQVVIAWARQHVTPVRIVVVRSTDGGLNWIGPIIFNNNQVYLTNLTYSSSGRFIAVYSKQDPTYTAQIYSTYSADGGASWSTPIQVFSQPNYQEYPAVTANGNNAVCVWQVFQTLYSATSTNGGGSWGNLHTFDSNYPSNDYPLAEWPSLAYDLCSGDFLCAWASQKNGGSQPEV